MNMIILCVRSVDSNVLHGEDNDVRCKVTVLEKKGKDGIV